MLLSQKYRLPNGKSRQDSYIVFLDVEYNDNAYFFEHYALYTTSFYFLDVCRRQIACPSKIVCHNQLDFCHLHP